MKVAIGADHGGFNLKPKLIEILKSMGIEYEDFGTFSSDSCDYPDFALPVAEAVSMGKADRGIVICGTGIGVSIVANKVKGIRCAHCHDVFSAKATRQHNDSNMLAFGERVIGAGLMEDIVRAWLTTEFEGGRHQKRIDKITEIENKYFK